MYIFMYIHIDRRWKRSKSSFVQMIFFHGKAKVIIFLTLWINYHRSTLYSKFELVRMFTCNMHAYFHRISILCIAISIQCTSKLGTRQQVLKVFNNCNEWREINCKQQIVCVHRLHYNSGITLVSSVIFALDKVIRYLWEYLHVSNLLHFL